MISTNIPSEGFFPPSFRRSKLENMSEGLYRSSIDGKLLSCNSAFARIFGYSSEAEMLVSIQNVGKNLYCFSGDREFLVQRLQNEQKVVGFETQAYHKSGDKIWIRINVLVKNNQENNIIFYEGSVLDITHEKKQAQEIIELTDFSAAVLENTGDIISILSVTGEIKYESPAISKILGYRQGERNGESAFSLVHPDDLDKIKTLFLQLSEKPNEAIRVIFRYLHKNGQYIFLETEAVNQLQHPRIKGILLNTRDISERIQFENELKSKNEEMQLNQQKIDRLIYSLSHEVRSPISSIKGIVNLIYQEEDKKQINLFAAMIEESSEKLDKFIHDLLQFSLLEKTKPVYEAIYLNDYMKDLHKHLMNIKEFSGIHMSLEMDREIILYTDKKRLQIVLIAILKNACDFADCLQFKHRIEIKLHARSKEVQLMIRDNGIGIDAAVLPKIFDMFYRGTHLSKGTGFGLFLAKEAAQQINCKIWVDSNIGEGTSFILSIPYTFEEEK